MMTREELNAAQQAWPDCAYWDVDDTTDRLTHRVVRDALEYAIDSAFKKGQSTEACIRENWPEGVTIYGWTRKVVDEEDIRRLTDAAVDAVLQAWVDMELGDPDDDEEKGDVLPKMFEEAVRKDVETRFVWACDQTHELELTLDELLGIARLSFGDWFEGDEKTPVFTHVAVTQTGDSVDVYVNSQPPGEEPRPHTWGLHVAVSPEAVEETLKEEE